MAERIIQPTAQTVNPLLASTAYEMAEFADTRTAYIKQAKNSDERFWKLDRANVSMQVTLLNYHFPLTVQDSKLFLYDDMRQKDIEIFDQKDINYYIGVIRRSYGFTSATTPAMKDLMSSGIISSKSAVFAKWDGKPRLMNVLDEFFELNPSAVILSDTTPDEIIEAQMRLAFAVWIIQFVARRKGYGDTRKGGIQYGVMPLIASADKGIGKSTFLKLLLSPAGNTRNASLRELLDPLQQGRLFAHNTGLILDELSPFELKRNLDAFKEVITADTYRVEEKFQQASNEILRDTAIAASTNRDVSDFSFYENDRRLQIISISRKEHPTDFYDYPFEQITAEASALIDGIHDKKKLRDLTRWSIENTLQADGDDSGVIYDFLLNFAKYVNKVDLEHRSDESSATGYEKLKVQLANSVSELIYKNQQVRFVDNNAILLYLALYRHETGHNGAEILAGLGFNDKEMEQNIQTHLYAVTKNKLNKRMGNYYAGISDKTDKHFIRKQTKLGRGFLVYPELPDKIVKSQLDLGSLAKKQNIIDEFANTAGEYHTAVALQIAGTKAWSTPDNTLDFANANQQVEMRIAPFNNRLIILETTHVQDVPEELPQESFIRDATPWVRVFFYLNEENMDKLVSTGTFDTPNNGDIRIYQNFMNPTVIETTPTWVDEMVENRGIGYLMSMKKLSQRGNE